MSASRELPLADKTDRAYREKQNRGLDQRGDERQRGDSGRRAATVYRKERRAQTPTASLSHRGTMAICKVFLITLCLTYSAGVAGA